MSASHRDGGPADGPAGQRRTFVLIPGAGGTAWYWHRIVPLLRRAGHEAIAVDLPGDDPPGAEDGAVAPCAGDPPHAIVRSHEGRRAARGRPSPQPGR